MKFNFKLVVPFILSLVVVIYFVQKAGELNLEDSANNVFVSIDVTADSTEKTLDFEAVIAGKTQHRILPIQNNNSNVLTFSLPMTDEITSWKIIADSTSKLHVSGALFATGKTSQFIQGNNLKTSSIKRSNRSKSTAFYPTKIQLQPVQFLTKLAGISGGVLLFFVLFYFWKFRSQPLRLAFAITLSFVFSLFIFFSLSYMKEAIDNVQIRIESTTNKKHPVDLYYAQSNAFSPAQLLSDTLSRVTPSRIDFQLPPGIFRMFRIDLPHSMEFQIRAVEIKHWLGTIRLEGKELVNAFALRNDIVETKNTAGCTTFKTGDLDPFIVLSSPELHNSITYLQAKKADYPLWIALLVFVVFVPVLTQTKKMQQTVFASLFGTFLMLPGISTVFKKDVDILTTENRPAFSRQQLSNSSVKDLPKNTTSYINDQFGGRESFTTTWNVMRILSFKQTNRNSPVVIGKNGWYFYVAEGVREMVENKRPISNDTLALMCSVLNERHDWLKLHDMDYYLVIPPLSHTLFKENLPSSLRLHYKESKLDQFLNYAKKHSRAKIIDLRKPLFKAKKKEKREIYYRVDSHWNLLGAYYGYAYLMEQIHKDHPEIGLPQTLTNYSWAKDRNNEGDLAKLLSMNNYLLRDELIPIPKKGYKAQMTTSILYPSYQSIHAAITYEQANKNLPKLCMNRDSYTNFLIPYMSEHFSRSVYLWTPLFNAEVFKEEKPDIVVSEMLERFIMDLSLPNPPIVQEELKKAGLR